MSSNSHLIYFTDEYLSLVIVEFEKVYQRLGVTIVDRGESFYQELMKDVVRELDDKGKVHESGHEKDCVWVF